MVPTIAKRHASRSPPGARPSKRPATSSPEEGELDDASPPFVPQPLPASLPPKPMTSKAKVPFPFKKKPEPSRNGSSNGTVDSKDGSLAGVYERSEEDERRIWEADFKRKASRPNRSDHWEPGQDRGDSRHYAPRRDHPPRDHRDRDRGRSPHSSFSPNRSRSPTSPHREKHRLPAPRSPPPNFSPPRRDYGLDRARDRDWNTWDAGRGGVRDRRYRDDGDDRYYSQY